MTPGHCECLTFPLQVGDLRLALQRAEQAAARKEDYLRHEISELQQVPSPLPRHKSESVFLEINMDSLVWCGGEHTLYSSMLCGCGLREQE